MADPGGAHWERTQTPPSLQCQGLLQVNVITNTSNPKGGGEDQGEGETMTLSLAVPQSAEQNWHKGECMLHLSKE